MINPTNPGAILPFYIESSGQMLHSRQVSRHVDGWKTLASDKKLIPFILWESAAPDVVQKLQVFNTNTGKLYDLSTSLIDRRRRSDNSKTWYIFDGSDIGQTLPCGTYRIRMELLLTTYISDEIQVVNASGAESMTLTVDSCSANTLTLIASETLDSTLSYEKLEYRLTNSEHWTQISPSSSSPYTFPFNIGAVTLPAGENILLRHTARTTAGSVLELYYSLNYDNADKCGTYEMYLIDDRSKQANENLWYLEIADSPLRGDKIYEDGFKERVYLHGHWDFPEPERETEILTDNQANAVLSTADTREFLVMVFEKVADHLLFKLTSIGDYSSISLNNVFTGYSISGIPGAETEFTSEPAANGYYSNGRLRFRDQKHFETACTDGETTIAI